jgi:aspartate/methionine/tyrosine aminotransferase
VLDAEGGWHAVLKAKCDEPDEELAIKLLRDAGVLVHPGHFYDFPVDGHLVLSLISPGEEFRSGVARMLEYLKRPA